MLKTYTIPGEDGRQVPDVGAQVILSHTLLQHHEAFAPCLLRLVLSRGEEPAGINEDVAACPVESGRDARREVPAELFSAVHQALRIGARYEVGDVVPGVIIASLESAVAILEDLAPQEQKKVVDRLSVLSPSRREVYSQWRGYIDEFGMHKDRVVYHVVKENGATERNWVAWSRQLRAARAQLGEQKNTPRRGRRATRSVVSADDLDPEDRRRMKTALGG